MVKAGGRVLSDNSDKLDTLHIILAGKTGILLQDTAIISNYKRDETFETAVHCMTQN